MRITLPVFIYAVLFLAAHAEDSPYRQTIQSVRDRFRALDVERRDYRKPKPSLPPDKEQERLRLLGQLVSDDPVWVLSQQLQADIDVLVARKPQTETDAKICDSLKDLLAIVTSYEERATTPEKARLFADTMRHFTAIRDAEAAHAWAKSQ